MDQVLASRPSAAGSKPTATVPPHRLRLEPGEVHDGGVVVAFAPRPAGAVGIAALGGPDLSEHGGDALAVQQAEQVTPAAQRELDEPGGAVGQQSDRAQ